MAKNLKLNVKNSQLAKALKLGDKAKETAKEAPEQEPKPVVKAKAKTLTPFTAKPPQEAQPPVEEFVQEETFAEETEETTPHVEQLQAPEIVPEVVKEEPVPEFKRTFKSSGLYEEELPKIKEPFPVRKKPPVKEPSQVATPSSTRPAETKAAGDNEAAKTLKKDPGKKLPAKDAAKPPARKEYRDFTQAKRFDSRDSRGLGASDEGAWRRKRAHKVKNTAQEEVNRPKELKVKLPITIKDLAVAMKLKSSALISKLFIQGFAFTLNDYLDDETMVQLLGHEFDCNITIDTSEQERLQITSKSILDEIKATPTENLSHRPPVIAFMGHVDHGKTSLIDALRKSNLAGKEAGAITQHIGAFTCKLDNGTITILDTPGHEAFSAMRERGATVTDMVILVVAGDEGIRQQTDEAIAQAKAANVPIIVALNKCDKPNFDADTVYRQLSERELLPEAWGGNVVTVNCSALTGEGMKDLLEMVLLQAELLELRADSVSRARGTVLESELHKGLGAAATLLVQNGTLKHGDPVVIGQIHGRVKTMHDEYGKPMREAGPSTPVKITGLSGVPDAGAEFVVVASEKEARSIASERAEGKEREALRLPKTRGLDDLMQREHDRQQKKILNVILRADVQGSLQALKSSLKKIQSKKVELNIVSDAVGEISESDIELAHASGAVIFGFHTQIESHAEEFIKKHQIAVKLHDIIYHLVDDVKEMMTNLLDKVREEREIGEARVQAIFKSSQLGSIAGCIVTDGLIKRNSFIKLIRDTKVVWSGDLLSLKRVKEDVKEVKKDVECGILLKNFQDVQVNDVIKAFDVVYIAQEL